MENGVPPASPLSEAPLSQSGPEQLAAGVPRATPDLLDRAGLAGRQARVVGRRARALRDRRVVDRVVGAGARIGDDAVDDAVVRVARGDRGIGREGLLGRRDRPAGVDPHRHLRPDLVCLKAIPMEGRRAGEDAVVVARELLCHAHALAAAGGAPVPVRELRQLAVEGLRELLADHRHLVLGAECEVGLQLDVGRAVRHRREHAEGAAAAGVTGVGLHADVAGRDRAGGYADAAGVAAATFGLQAAVPRAAGRQPDPDVDRRRHEHLDQTVGHASCGARGNGRDRGGRAIRWIGSRQCR